MSEHAERSAPVKRPAKREIVVNFDPIEVRAPFILRCGALLVDYIVVAIVPVAGLLLSRYMGYDGANLLNGEINNAGWLIAVFFAVSNLIILPVFSGRTVGKILTGLRIVKIDGNEASLRSLVFRQTAGYLLTLASAGVGFVISVFSSKGRALHDYIAGTIVIYADKRPRI